MTPHLLAQLAWVFDRDAAELTRESKRFESVRRPTDKELAEDFARRCETRRLRDIACELEARAMNDGYVGYPFGDEA